MKFKFRKRYISVVFGVLFTLYFIAVSVVWHRLHNFNAVMIFFGLLWIFVSVKINVFIDLYKKLPKAIKITFNVLVILFIISFFAIQGIIIKHMRSTAPPDADYVIVLGCQVAGDYASVPMIRRVYTASRYLKENQSTMAVITGGQGPGENMPEAEMMKRLLIQYQIDKDRILEEDQSKSTKENFIFSDELYDLRDKNVVIVTSDYHMFRALSAAKRLNYKNVSTLTAKTELSALPAYLLREYSAVVFYLLLGRI